MTLRINSLAEGLKSRDSLGRWVSLTLISKGENQYLLAWEGSCLTVSRWHISEASWERGRKLVLLMGKKLRGNYTF